MGCHTWFSVPYKTDKNEIIKIAQDWLNNSDARFVTDGHRKMYQYAIDNELKEPILELAGIATDCNSFNEWILYKGIKDYSIEKYKEQHNIDIDPYDYEAMEQAGIENYSSEPRIGGYPDKIIKSYKEMVDFVKTGFTDEDGKHYDFRYDEDRKETFMKGIKQFFTNHPQGIITFG